MKRLENVVFANIIVFLLIVFLLPCRSINAKELFPNDDEYLIGAETMPTPVGGMEAVVKKITNMGMIRDVNVNGKVYLLVYINEQGDVDDAKVVKGIGGGCDEAAIEAIKRSKFTPASNGSKKVKVKMTLAIVFKN